MHHIPSMFHCQRLLRRALSAHWAPPVAAAPESAPSRGPETGPRRGQTWGKDRKKRCLSGNYKGKIGLMKISMFFLVEICNYICIWQEEVTPAIFRGKNYIIPVILCGIPNVINPIEDTVSLAKNHIMVHTPTTNHANFASPARGWDSQKNLQKIHTDHVMIGDL